MKNDNFIQNFLDINSSNELQEKPLMVACKEKVTLKTLF